MPLRPQEFIKFVASHYHQIARMCSERRRFASDDDIAAFLRLHSDDPTNPARLLGVMKDMGVLVRGAGDWTTPAFLNRFMNDLHDRQRLASPLVVQGWIKTLEGHVRELQRVVTDGELNSLGPAGDHLLRLFDDVMGTFDAVVQTVEDNCQRISSEVADYRKLEDAATMRVRLNRLCALYDNYLSPILGIIDVSGEFYGITELLANCCAELADRAGPLADEAGRAANEVRWLRQRVTHRADEASRELGPLRQAALRESILARGVNRALEAVRQDEWGRLALPRSLQVTEDKDSTLFANRMVDSYLKRVFESRRRTFPRILAEEPDVLEPPLTADDLLHRLEAEVQVDDLLNWIMAHCPDEQPDSVLRMFQGILRKESKRAMPGDQPAEYAMGCLSVEAVRWQWERRRDAE